MLVEFDTRAMGDDVKVILLEQGRGAKNRAIKQIGCSHATFFRFLDGPPVKNIDTILSILTFFELKPSKYVRSPYL